VRRGPVSERGRPLVIHPQRLASLGQGRLELPDRLLGHAFFLLVAQLRTGLDEGERLQKGPLGLGGLLQGPPARGDPQVQFEPEQIRVAAGQGAFRVPDALQKVSGGEQDGTAAGVAEAPGGGRRERQTLGVRGGRLQQTVALEQGGRLFAARLRNARVARIHEEEFLDAATE